MLVHAVDQPNLAPLEMPARFRTEIVFFMSFPGERGAPAKLGEGEYWIAPDDAHRYLDEMVVYVVSPLDASSQAEIELTEYHEAFLQWLVTHEVKHVRLA
ncbi:MAG: hypothetical protein WD872_02125 [Pirellulaceae bacterium]